VQNPTANNANACDAVTTARALLRGRKRFCEFVGSLSYHNSGYQDNKMGQPTPRLAASDADVRSCFAVMRQLRTYLASEEDLLQRVRGLEAAQGYKLAFVSADDQVVAAAGYAYYTNLERADPKCAPLWLCCPA